MKEEYPLGKFIKDARSRKKYSIREVCRKIEESNITGCTVSPAYLSQVELGRHINTDKISMDFFWAVGVALEVDPMTMFVLSRPNIPARFADPLFRKRLIKE